MNIKKNSNPQQSTHTVYCSPHSLQVPAPGDILGVVDEHGAEQHGQDKQLGHTSIRPATGSINALSVQQDHDKVLTFQHRCCQPNATSAGLHGVAKPEGLSSTKHARQEVRLATVIRATHGENSNRLSYAIEESHCFWNQPELYRSI